MVSIIRGGMYLKKDKQVLYFYMISVTIGTVLIALAIMRYIVKVNEPERYLMLVMLVLGFVLITNYINYLNQFHKSVISKS